MVFRIEVHRALAEFHGILPVYADERWQDVGILVELVFALDINCPMTQGRVLCTNGMQLHDLLMGLKVGPLGQLGCPVPAPIRVARCTHAFLMLATLFPAYFAFLTL